MALPTKTDLQTMDYSYGGVPFVSVATKAGIDLDTLDYSYAGVPFWGLEVSGGGAKLHPHLCRWLILADWLIGNAHSHSGIAKPDACL